MSIQTLVKALAPEGFANWALKVWADPEPPLGVNGPAVRVASGTFHVQPVCQPVLAVGVAA